MRFFDTSGAITYHAGTKADVWRVEMRIRAGLVGAAAVMFGICFCACSEPPKEAVDIKRQDLAALLPGEGWISQEVFRPWELFNSEFYSNLKDNQSLVMSLLHEFWVQSGYFGLDRRKVLAITSFNTHPGSERDLLYITAEYSLDEMKQFLQVERNWELVEEKVGSNRYFFDKRKGECILPMPNGFLFGKKEIIEEVVAIGESGLNTLADSDSYQEARKLIDPTATKYTFVWAEEAVALVRSAWKGRLAPLVADESVVIAMDGIVAIGVSTFWRDDHEIVQKILFDSEESAKTVADGIGANLPEILENSYTLLLTDLFAEANVKDAGGIGRLAEKAIVRSEGPVLEVRFKFSWDDLSGFFQAEDGE